jgi:hypothetical protein
MLQIICQMHSQITKVSLNLRIMYSMHLKEWSYQRKPLTYLLQRRGGGKKPLKRIMLQKSDQEMRRLKLLKNQESESTCGWMTPCEYI